MRTLAIAVAAGLALSAGPAFAAEPDARKLAVVPVDMGTNAEPALADALMKALEAGASTGGTEVARADESCADAACFAAVADETGASHVVAAAVTVKLNDYRVELTARDSSGAVQESVEFACEICTRPDLEAKLARETAALCGKLDATKQDDPPTASVPDPAPVAAAPQPSGPPPQRDRAADASRARAFGIAGYASLGVGMGAVVAGGVLLGIDGRPVRSRCTGENIDVNGQCQFLHDTLVVGAVLTSVGVAAIVTGVALAIVGGRSRKSQRRAAATIGGIRF